MIKLNDKQKRGMAIIGLMAIVMIAYSQFAPETDPIASQLVRSESMDRRIGDQEIKQDIMLRDNQTAQEISRQSQQQKQLLDKQIDAMERTFKLLDQTYNNTDKLTIQNPIVNYINMQRKTASLHFQIAQGFRFGSSILESHGRERVVSRLLRSTELNKEGWNTMKLAMKNDNNMDIGARLQMIEKANQLTIAAQSELIAALNEGQENTKLMETMASIQQLPGLFKFKLD
jgi:hypothetical protein